METSGNWVGWVGLRKNFKLTSECYDVNNYVIITHVEAKFYEYFEVTHWAKFALLSKIHLMH